MIHNKSISIILIITLFSLFSISNFGIIKAQQIDTIKINDSYSPIKIISSIDTIIVDEYSKEYLITMSIYNLETGDFIQEISDTFIEESSVIGISYYDINLDELKDINVKYEDDYGNIINSIWLYDSTHNLFFYSDDFSQLDEYSIEDYENKIITAYESWYRGMVCYTTYKYKIDGTRLILIEREGCGKFGDGGPSDDSYYFYKEKLINGKVRSVELDSLIHIDDKYIIKSYDFFHDTLLVSSIYWTNDKEERLTDSSNLKIYYETHFTGTLRCYKKAIYNYSTNSEGILECVVDEYIVENEKWLRIQ